MAYRSSTSKGEVKRVIAKLKQHKTVLEISYGHIVRLSDLADDHNTRARIDFWNRKGICWAFGTDGVIHTARKPSGERDKYISVSLSQWIVVYLLAEARRSKKGPGPGQTLSEICAIARYGGARAR